MESKKYFQNQFDVEPHSNAALQNRTAVLLVNFGGPDSPKTVKSFLYNLFCDPTVLNLPFGFLYRNLLAWLIATIRNKASSEMYKSIGSISPLIPITYLQCNKLQELITRNKLPIDIFIGFRYCNPLIEGVLSELKDKGYKKIVVLPLYPQYSYTTTGSVELVINKWISHHCDNSINIRFIKNWHGDEDYIESYAGLIKRALEHLDLRSTEIIFSAHSIPVFNIENGDPYEKQIKETSELIIKRLDWKKKWHIAYQSKLGPVKWLEPGTDLLIEEIGRKNKNANLLIVPISFTCEHVETIYEIGKLYRDIAKKAGIKQFRRVPALNTDKYLIQALYNQILNCIQDEEFNICENFVKI